MSTSSNCGCNSSRSLWGVLMFSLVALLIGVAVTIALAVGAGYVASLDPVGVASSPALLALGVTLLVPILVLLGLTVLLMLLLLWCCCRGKNLGLDLGWLAKLLPALRDAGPALEQIAAALDGVALALHEAKVPVKSAGDAVHDAGDKVDISIPTIDVHTSNFPRLGQVVTGIDVGSAQPFGNARDELHDMGEALRGPEGLAGKLEDASQRCSNAAAGLRSLKALFGI